MTILRSRESAKELVGRFGVFLAISFFYSFFHCGKKSHLAIKRGLPSWLSDKESACNADVD